MRPIGSDSPPAPPAGAVRVPDGFLWGAATASHQVEGDNRRNDWWAWEAAGRLPEASGRACEHYERFREDFDLARDLGHNAHRLSLEWSRFEPEPDRFDPAAGAHYRAVLEALQERGLEPLVTLHHFTNPAWFLERGGWTRRDAAQRFGRYVEHVVRELGDRARYWVTINEPTVYARHAYLLGEWPPMRRGAWWAASRVLVHLAQAHGIAHRLLKEARPENRVGFAHSAALVLPCDPARARDRRAAGLRDRLLNRWFLERIGGAAQLDWLGLNYYNRTFVRAAGLGATALLGRACKEAHHELGPVGQTGWEMHAAGLEAVLVRFAELGVPLIVTENGLATDDEALRTRFLREHLTALGRALARGVDVRGYLYWSLMDNYEWTLGRRARFGLASTDFATFERRPRPAARELERCARSGFVPAS